jgi:hypothetical protein
MLRTTSSLDGGVRPSTSRCFVHRIEPRPDFAGGGFRGFLRFLDREGADVVTAGFVKARFENLPFGHSLMDQIKQSAKLVRGCSEVKFQPLYFVIIKDTSNFIDRRTCLDKQVVLYEQGAFKQSDFYGFSLPEKYRKYREKGLHLLFDGRVLQGIKTQPLVGCGKSQNHLPESFRIHDA